jgi:hypothetical protein
MKGGYIIIKLEIFAVFKKRLEKFLSPSASSVLFFEGGKACGEEFCAYVGQDIDADQLLQQVVKFMDENNWGKVRFPGDRVIVRDSFEARRYGIAQRPVCHFLRGFLSDVLSYVSSSNVVLIERNCAAMGGEFCEFEVWKR